MHADALPPPQQREPGWGLPLALALLVHLLVALVFIVAVSYTHLTLPTM